MKVEVEEINKVQRRLKLVFSQQEVMDAFNSEYQKIRKKAQIKGFRRGKAPLSIIKRFYKEHVQNDVVNSLVKGSLYDAITERSINPIAAPVLEVSQLPKEDEDFLVTAVCDIMPELKIEEYKGLTLSFSPMKVDQQGGVEAELKRLQRQHAKTKELPDEAQAQSGHLIEVSVEATEEGKPEKCEAFSFDKLQIELGQDHGRLGEILSDEDTLSLLQGAKAQDERTTRIKIPKDHPHKDYQDRLIDFKIKVIRLSEINLSDIDDEFAKDLGFEDLKKVKENIEDSLNKQVAQHKRNQLESKFFETIMMKYSFDVPPVMTDRVIDDMIKEMRWPTESEYKAALKDKTFRNRFREIAEQRAKRALIIDTIVKKEQIDVPDSDVRSEVDKMLGALGGATKETKDYSDLSQMLFSGTKHRMVCDKAMDFIIDNAVVLETEAST